jgi:hypothetical protein
LSAWSGGEGVAMTASELFGRWDNPFTRTVGRLIGHGDFIEMAAVSATLFTAAIEIDILPARNQ